MTSQSRDVNKHGGGVSDIVTSHVEKDGGRTFLRRSRDLNKHDG